DVGVLRNGIWGAITRAIGEQESAPVAHEFADRDKFATALVDALARQSGVVWLVFDDVHEVTDRPALQQLETLLRAAPATLRMIMCGRRAPELALHRLRIEGRLREIHAADLAFTHDDAAQVLAAHGARLPEPVVGRVMELTEGWPVAVRLAALALSERDRHTGTVESVITADRAVIDYLNREVISELTIEQQDFLLCTCVCESFDSALATELTRRADAPDVLASLVSSGALVRPAERQDWYRQQPFL